MNNLRRERIEKKLRTIVNAAEAGAVLDSWALSVDLKVPEMLVAVLLKEIERGGLVVERPHNWLHRDVESRSIFERI